MEAATFSFNKMHTEMQHAPIIYRKTSSTGRTKSRNLNVSCLVFQLSLPNPLNPGFKLRTKM